MTNNVPETKNNKPLVDLMVSQPKSKLGLLKASFTTPNNILEEDSDINDMFYGKQIGLQ
jgi:hypothetical protein